MSYEITDFSRSYGIRDFQPADTTKADVIASDIPPHIDLTDLPTGVDAFTQTLILNGDDPDNPIGTSNAHFPSRSEAVFRVVCDLLSAGCTFEQAMSILLDRSYAISTSILEKRQPERYAAKQVRAAAEAVADGWPDADRRGPKSTYRNTVVAIRRLGLQGRSDQFHHRKTLGGHQLQLFQGELSDDLCSMVRSLIIDEFGFDPGKFNTIEAANFVCLDNPFHPVRDYLDKVEWDEQSRLDSLLTRYFGAEDTLLNRQISRKVLVAAVRRVRRPGVKFDTVLVLEGKQGSGKSTAIRILAGEDNFSDQDILSLDAKQQIELIEGVWLFEIGELSGMNTADIARLKAFVSRQVDRARPAYGRYREDRPRQTVFIGTTNQETYLRDPTGNRRFWPVATTVIDLAALTRDRDQLWAEAAQAEEQDESLTLPEELWGDAAVEQNARMEEHPWLDTLASARGVVVNGRERITTEQIFSNTLDIAAERRQPYQLQLLARLMTRLGWTGPKRLKVDGKTLRGYERESGEPDTPEHLRGKLF